MTTNDWGIDWDKYNARVLMIFSRMSADKCCLLIFDRDEDMDYPVYCTTFPQKQQDALLEILNGAPLQVIINMATKADMMVAIETGELPLGFSFDEGNK